MRPQDPRPQAACALPAEKAWAASAPSIAAADADTSLGTMNHNKVSGLQSGISVTYEKQAVTISNGELTKPVGDSWNLPHSETGYYLVVKLTGNAGDTLEVGEQSATIAEDETKAVLVIPISQNMKSKRAFDGTLNDETVNFVIANSVKFANDAAAVKDFADVAFDVPESVVFDGKAVDDLPKTGNDNGTQVTLKWAWNTADGKAPIKPGSYTATASAVGYEGERSFAVTVEKADLADQTVAGVADSYTNADTAKSEIQKNFRFTTIKSYLPVSGVDYRLEVVPNAADGTVTVTATALSESECYTGAWTKAVKLTDEKTSVENATVTFGTVYWNFGEKVQAKPVVSIGDIILQEGTDYTLSYEGNDAEVGDATTVTVTGKGTYSGTTSEKYKVQKIALSKAVVTVSKSYEWTGKEIQPADEDVIVTFGGKVVPAEAYTVNKATGNTNVTTESSKATVTVSAKDKDHYDGTSSDNLDGKANGAFDIVARHQQRHHHGDRQRGQHRRPGRRLGQRHRRDQAD